MVCVLPPPNPRRLFFMAGLGHKWMLPHEMEVQQWMWVGDLPPSNHSHSTPPTHGRIRKPILCHVRMRKFDSMEG